MFFMVISVIAATLLSWYFRRDSEDSTLVVAAVHVWVTGLVIASLVGLGNLGVSSSIPSVRVVTEAIAGALMLLLAYLLFRFASGVRNQYLTGETAGSQSE